MRPITRYPILLLLLTVLFLATGCSDDTHTLMKKAQAQLGNVEAQLYLGAMYSRSGVEQDLKKALYWYGKVADKGSREAMNEIERIVMSWQWLFGE